MTHPLPPPPNGRLALRIRLSGTSKKGNAEHVVFLGASQMGKSTAAESVLRQCKNLVIIDPAGKGQFSHLGVSGEDPDLILRHPVVIWQPPAAALAKPAKDFSDPWSRGLWHIRTTRRRSGVAVYHDEARRTLPTHPHPWAGEMVDLGAGQGIAVLASTQGFSRVYPPLFDSATHWFLFRCASASQRGSLAASLEVDGLHLGRLKPHTFHHWRQGDAHATGPHSLSALR